MIVLDANILIRAVLGRRVRQLVDTYASRGFRFVTPDVAFIDAETYLPPLLTKRGKPDADVLQSLDYLRQIIESINPDFYGEFESEARERLRGRDDGTAGNERVSEGTGRNRQSLLCVSVVQLVRTPACHAGGRGFESRCSRQLSDC